jgi:MFS family permease
MSRRAPLRGWLVSDAISMTGTRISMIAIPWFVLTTTGSATQTGLVAFAEMAPLVLAKAAVGPVIDRVGARRVSITCDLGSVVAIGLVPLLHAAGMLGFPLLLGIVAIAGALRGPGDAAKHALIPALVEHAGVPMERATGLHSTVERTASMAGAAFAGGLVALVGPTNAMTVDAVSFGISALVLWTSTRAVSTGSTTEDGSTTGDGSTTQEPTQAGRTGYWRELRSGWEFLRREPLLFGITMMVATTNLVDQAFSVVLVPVWARETGGGAAAIGLLFAVFSGASIAGSLTAAAWAARMPRFRTYLVAFLLCGAPRFWVLVLDTPLWLVLGVMVVGGFASGFLNPILGAVIFERIPKPLVGRVSSLSTAICWSLMPLGGLAGGLLVSGFGLGWALAAAGAAYLVATMAPAVGPRFRAMDARTSGEQASAERASAEPRGDLDQAVVGLGLADAGAHPVAGEGADGDADLTAGGGELHRPVPQ